MHVYLNYNLQSNACTIKLSFPNIQMFFLVHCVLGLLQLMRELKKNFIAYMQFRFYFVGVHGQMRACMCVRVFMCVRLKKCKRFSIIIWNNKITLWCTWLVEWEDENWYDFGKAAIERKGGIDLTKIYIYIYPSAFCISHVPHQATERSQYYSAFARFMRRSYARACINEWMCMCVFTCACVSNDDWYYIK